MTRAAISFYARVIVAYALYYTGIMWLWQTLVMRDKAVVLMYHRVLTPGEAQRSGSHPALIVGPDTFSRHMAILKRRFAVLSMDEFAEFLLAGRPFPPSSCLITFDDGWRDNYRHALPALQAANLPAVVFLPARYVGTSRVFWQEALTHLLTLAVNATDTALRERLHSALAPAGLASLLPLSAAREGRASREQIQRAVTALKRRPRAEVEQLVTTLAPLLGVPVQRFAEVDGFLDWNEVAEMASSRIAFGGHGAEHFILTQVPPDVAETEILESRRSLDRTPGAFPVFSYPNGNHDQALAAQTRAAGFTVAFGTHRGHVTCRHDPLSLPRMNMHEAMTSTTPMFLARVLGLW